MLQTAEPRSRPMRALKTHREIIDFLGGADGILAIEPALSAIEIRHWLSIGIPNSWHYRVHLWCAARGAVISPAAFGLTAHGLHSKARPVKGQEYARRAKVRGK